MKLRVSIVTHAPDIQVLRSTLQSLETSAARLDGVPVDLVIINNGPDENKAVLEEMVRGLQLTTRIVSGSGNVGYGRGHNLAVGDSGDYHLVLNPDVDLAEDALANALAFMQEHPDCGLLTPAVENSTGERQYLCKRYPTILVLGLRGFAPQWLKRPFATRLAWYEMRDVIGDKVVRDPPIVSGCFMFFRAEVLRALHGFDPGYFLYFEDFDISLRAAKISRIAYVPAVRITHHGGHAARKGLTHLKFFGASALKFFTRHGWRWW